MFFLDYVAANAIDLEQVAELVEGAAEVCRAAGVALIGGETAELPGVYKEDELDFAGTCVGFVERENVIDGSRVAEGDVVLGFPSSGLHTNGFTLVRRLVGDDDFDADLLLQPHRLYLDDVRALRSRADVRALAHITGGGIPGNLARVLPEGLGAHIDSLAWRRPPSSNGSRSKASSRRNSVACSTSASATARSSRARTRTQAWSSARSSAARE